jgi:hypothetical protein
MKFRPGILGKLERKYHKLPIIPGWNPVESPVIYLTEENYQDYFEFLGASGQRPGTLIYKGIPVRVRPND